MKHSFTRIDEENVRRNCLKAVMLRINVCVNTRLALIWKLTTLILAGWNVLMKTQG